MTRLLVLFYSSYGHVETMARAVAEGVAEVPGCTVDLRRVPETVPETVRLQAGYCQDTTLPEAAPADLEGYQGILFGTPTRFGNMAAQMRAFLDQTGGLWARKALVGVVGSVFGATSSQHGGQETTLTSFHTTLFHHGMVVVGLPYTCPELTTMEEIAGGTPYGATTLAGGDGKRPVSPAEQAMARFQGRHVAAITQKLHG